MKAETAGATRSGAEHRQRYTQEFRDRLVGLTLEPGASVSAVALKHQLNTNLLFNWRRRHLRELALAKLKAPKLLAVNVESQGAPAQNGKGSDPAPVSPATGTIEIELPAGRVRLNGLVDADTLRLVVRILSER